MSRRQRLTLAATLCELSCLIPLLGSCCSPAVVAMLYISLFSRAVQHEIGFPLFITAAMLALFGMVAGFQLAERMQEWAHSIRRERDRERGLQ